MIRCWTVNLAPRAPQPHAQRTRKHRLGCHRWGGRHGKSRFTETLARSAALLALVAGDNPGISPASAI